MVRARRSVALVVAVLLLTPLLQPVVAQPATSVDRGWDCSFPVTRIDSDGTEVTLTERPERIVPINASFARILWDIGVQDRVVAIPEKAAYLERESVRPVVVTNQTIRAGRIDNVDPDLVLVPDSTPERIVQQLRVEGFSTFALDVPTDTDNASVQTRRIGRLAGSCRSAAATNAWLRENLNAVSGAVAIQPSPTGIYVGPDGRTIGSGTYIHSLLTAARLENGAALQGARGTAPITPLLVRRASPEWIVLSSRSPTVPDDPHFRNAPAGERNATVVVNATWLEHPSPSAIVRATLTIARTVYPQAVGNDTFVPRSALPPPTPRPDSRTLEADGFVPTTLPERETDVSLEFVAWLVVLPLLFAFSLFTVWYRRRRPSR